MDTADIQRRLENLIRIGTIAEVDLRDSTAPRVRVQDGKLRTGWLPFGTIRAGAARVWSAPTVGEQVVMLSPSGELASAVVICSLYCAQNPAPSTQPTQHIVDFEYGTRWSHDTQAGASVFSGMKTLLIKASQSVTVDTPATNLNGTVAHKGDSLSSNGVTLHTHAHTGITPGKANTGGPAT